MSSTPFQHPDAENAWKSDEDYKFFNVCGQTFSALLPKQLQKPVNDSKVSTIIEQSSNQDFVNTLQMQALHDK
jgi:hypothetical protein